MLRLGWAEFSERILKATTAVLSLIAIVVAASLKVNLEAPQVAPFKAMLLWVTGNAFWVLPFAILLGGFVAYIQRRIGHPLAWSVVHYILGEYRELLSGSKRTSPRVMYHHDKVTLYKYQHWRFARPFSRPGWLVPVSRCGETMKARIPVFRAPLHDPDQAEGVCGRAWAARKPIQISDLPDVNTNNPSEKDLITYAAKAYVPVEWVKRRMRVEKQFARSYLAIPIERKGKIWGILVFDSRDPALVYKRPASSKHALSLAGILSEAIERS